MIQSENLTFFSSGKLDSKRNLFVRKLLLRSSWKFYKILRRRLWLFYRKRKDEIQQDFPFPEDSCMHGEESPEVLTFQFRFHVRLGRIAFDCGFSTKFPLDQSIIIITVPAPLTVIIMHGTIALKAIDPGT